MPGFFETLKRMAKGESVYRPDEMHDTGVTYKADREAQAQAEANADRTPTHAADTHDGRKELPEVRIEEARSHLNGSHLRCDAIIFNESPYEVYIDYINVLNRKRELDTLLRPGEKREFLVYDGEAPNHQNYHDAELQFKDTAGDYFVAKHDVFFDPADDRYVIRRFQYSGLKDI